MKMTTDQVLDLLSSELRAAGYPPTPVEVAQMRACLDELNARHADRPARIARRLVAHRRRLPMFLVPAPASPRTLAQGDAQR